jgi:hypothetical protein
MLIFEARVVPTGMQRMRKRAMSFLLQREPGSISSSKSINTNSPPLEESKGE